MTITAQGHPEDDKPHGRLQLAGEFCLSCKDFWDSQKLPLKRMVNVHDAHGEVMTTDEGIPIVVCPHCDGELILRHKK